VRYAKLEKKQGKGDKMADKILFWIAIWGELTGWVLILLVSVWDLLMLGFRKFYSFNIGWKGVCLIWIAIILVSLSKHLDEKGW
jgi:hypothetical protein